MKMDKFVLRLDNAIKAINDADYIIIGFNFKVIGIIKYLLI